MSKPDLICVILCGGVGSRLWPLSRELHPKPFITTPDGFSLIQKSFLLCNDIPLYTEIITVTNKSLYFSVIDEFKKLNLNKQCLSILEPFGHNTGPAIVTAALEIQSTYGDEMPMLVLSADHLINDKESFNSAVINAVELATQNRLVTFGIKPTYPETGFGYIKYINNSVISFIEKPTKAKASEFLSDGNYLWNAGIFCFKTGVLLYETKFYKPDLVETSKISLDNAIKSSDIINKFSTIIELIDESFVLTPNISIDYALFEKSSNISVIPCDIGWSDIGSWTRYTSLFPKDNCNNSNNGLTNLITLKSDNCNVYNSNNDKTVALLGVQNLTVVDTEDALLVLDNKNDQDVKKIYDYLKLNNNITYKNHRTVYKPWGSFTILEKSDRFQIKRLEIKPGGSSSYQLHRHRNEHWIVVSGMAEVTCDDKVFFLDTNESTYIKAGLKHRVVNNGKIPLIMIEVQTGAYLGEDDIVRYEDIYGRLSIFN
ncbi:MAG: mannose-1-phosphate guanylyltransferase/mannose-6-phosphate isomerase [Deltaproteobacteria bacterium]|jgi:mannose-1-phosphate guanylyltransferase|nr:mannose-1-phosphate guanylyltransferase/mannose-6-phosphate isomerase [Deltaproteobacteria bacterium]